MKNVTTSDMKKERDSMASIDDIAMTTTDKSCGEECAEIREDFQVLVDDVGAAVGSYCRRRPGAVAFAVFALGFFVGWKLKPW
jgi:hypothetical protein